jgi:hypothetical protein
MAGEATGVSGFRRLRSLLMLGIIRSMNNRRNFLKALGVGAAIVPTVNGHELVKVDAVGPVPAPQFPATEFLSAPQLGGFQGVVTSDWLYSMVEIERNQMQSRIVFFGDSVGAPRANGKGYSTLTHTNLCRGFQLPPPEMFLVQRLGLIFPATTVPGLRSFFTDCYAADLQLGDTILFRAPVASMFCTLDPATFADGRYPGAALRGSVELDIPVLIESLQQFSFYLSGTPIPVHGKVKVWAYLAGRHLRPRQ